jgi:HEAT repeat protein
MEPPILARLGARYAGNVKRYFEYVRDPRTLPWLCELPAAQASESVRQAALWALGSLWPGDHEAGAVLRRIADGKGESRTREMAVLAVTTGWRDDPDIRLLLRRPAVGLDATYVRATAIRMLGACLRDDPGTEEVLRERAEKDPDSYVRTTAVRALVLGFRSSRTGDLLRRLAVDDPDEFLRAEVILLLPEHPHADQAGVVVAVGLAVRQQAVQVLAEAVDRGLGLVSNWVRDSCIAVSRRSTRPSV